MPTDLFQQAGMQPQAGGPRDLLAAADEQPLPYKIGGDIAGGGKGIGEYGLGASHALASLPVQLSNLLNVGISKIPGAKEILPSKLIGQYQLPEFGKGAAYEAGKPVGTGLSFLGGGEALEAGRVGLEAVPMLGRLAKFIAATPEARAVSRIAGTGGYGALTSPGDRLGGLERGMAVAAGGEMLPEVMEAAKYIRPMVRAKQILQELGGGKTLNENSKDIARGIRNSYLRNIASARNQYSPIMKEVGNKQILPDIYNKMSSRDINSFTRSAQKAHNTFANSPTFENAHALQSVLGHESASLGKSGLDIAGKQSQGAMMDARSALQKDMGDYLDDYDPTKTLGNKYKSVSDFYKKYVIPYTTREFPGAPNFANIAKGFDTDPTNITRLFTRPKKYAQNIINDMGPVLRNKVLYSKLGLLRRNLTPERLLDAYDKLDEQGLSSHITPELHEQMDVLGRGIKRRNLAQRATFAGIGAAAAQHFGHILPYLGEEGVGASALMGGALGPYITRRIGTKVPSLLEEEGRNAGRQQVYDMIRKALIANLTTGAQ